MPRPCERSFALDEMHVILLDDTDVALPCIAEPIPGFDHIAVAVRQIIWPIEHERRSDLLAGTGGCAAGLIELIGDCDDLFDLPLHAVFSCGCFNSPVGLTGLATPQHRAQACQGRRAVCAVYIPLTG